MLTEQEIYEQLGKIKAEGYKVQREKLKFIDDFCPMKANIFGNERPIEEKRKFSSEKEREEYIKKEGCSCYICIITNSILPYLDLRRLSWQKNCEAELYYINQAAKDGIINFLKRKDYLMPNGN